MTDVNYKYINIYVNDSVNVYVNDRCVNINYCVIFML